LAGWSLGEILTTEYGNHRIAILPLMRHYSDTAMSSRLEERVHVLCDRAIAAKTQRELDAALPELKAAIRDHIRYIRAMAAATIPEAFGTRPNPNFAQGSDARS
jgi:hypothetical protein